MTKKLKKAEQIESIDRLIDGLLGRPLTYLIRNRNTRMRKHIHTDVYVWIALE